MNATKNIQKLENLFAQFYTESLKSLEAQVRLKTATNHETLCKIIVELSAEMGYYFTIEQIRTALSIEAVLRGKVLEESNLFTYTAVCRFKRDNGSSVQTSYVDEQN